MAIEFHQENVEIKDLDEQKSAAWLEDAILTEGFESGDINLIFCNDEYLLNMNQQYLKHDYYTDIITFDYTENKLVSGDLFISIDRVNDNAKTLSVDPSLELSRVMVHGILHLCGFKDKNPEEKDIMTERENFYLLRLQQ